MLFNPSPPTVAYVCIFVLLAAVTSVLEGCTGVSSSGFLTSDGDSGSAVNAIKAMGLGINLGQKFDDKQKIYAGDPTALINSFADAGFTHIRIPVTWGETMGSRGDDFVRRVAQAVRHALSKGLWVVLNTHHEHWLKAHYNGEKSYDDEFRKLWVDISTYFKTEGGKLVFEVLNEPEDQLGAWSGAARKPNDPRAIELTKKINSVGYEAIRSVSETRIILVSPNAQANANQLKAVYGHKSSLPRGGNDPYLGVTVHTYDPWECCGETGSNNECGSAPKVDFDGISQWSTRTGIPVHWGEFGIGRKDQASRSKRPKQYYTKVTRETLKRGMSPCVWDDQGWFQVSTGNGQWVDGIKDALFQGKQEGQQDGSCCDSCQSSPFCSPKSMQCHHSKSKDYYESCSASSPAPSCCSSCHDSPFCSPRSMQCHHSKSKDYYESCSASSPAPSCCSSCQDSPFCSPRSMQCHHSKHKDYYESCSASSPEHEYCCAWGGTCGTDDFCNQNSQNCGKCNGQWQAK